ncbi:MAG: hypothetical protein COA88_16005 [Kordia sp.]|nr:MAG: hypothetical protein COA88_16005 [Kordia sp.]
MKRNFTLLVLLIALISSLSYGQESSINSYSNQFIENCIREVFQDKANELVFNSNSRRLSAIQDFFKNRLEIVSYKQEYEQKDLIKLSSIGLSNKYNSQLTRDVSFNQSTFNPLKYKLDIFPGNTVMYKVDNTDYIIIIKPSRNK